MEQGREEGQRAEADNVALARSAANEDGGTETAQTAGIMDTKDTTGETGTKDGSSGGDDWKKTAKPSPPESEEDDTAGVSDVESEDVSGVKEEMESNKESCGHRLVQTSDLDQIMDMGTVDQEEQEAQMKDEEEIMSVTDDGIASLVAEDNTTGVLMNGIKVVKVSAEQVEMDRLQVVSKSPSPPPPASPPLIKVKDEPIDDEEYNQALTSTSTDDIKSEPDILREDLQISSVCSAPSAPSETSGARPTPQQSASQQNPAPAPHVYTTLSVVCSKCKKFLLKGQTAFQRKGSPELFCSPFCLSARPPESGPRGKTCHYCLKGVARPQDLILAPVNAKGIMKEFCSPACLASFNYKRTAAIKTPAMPLSICSMCKNSCITKHDVMLHGITHSICSNTCFTAFRAVNKLKLSTCVNCGSYSNKSLMLKMLDGNKLVCSMECLAKFKEKTKSAQPCTMCRALRSVSEMVDNKDSKGMVELFCTTGCLLAHKIQIVSVSGSMLSCDSCGKIRIPAYHLAMSDASIRNFCALHCVLAYQEVHNKSQKPGSATTKAQVTSTQIQTATIITPISTPTAAQIPASTSSPPDTAVKGAVPKLRCSQCCCLITGYPEVVQIKDKMVFLCGLDCSDEFKRVNSLMNVCEHCKSLRTCSDVKRIEQRTCYFCSEGCKLLYKHELTKKWGDHCRCCAFCFSITSTVVKGQFGGQEETFCSEVCRSKHAMLMCQASKCESCGFQGKLNLTLPLLGNPKRFCKLQCLLQFGAVNTLAQGKLVLNTPGPGGSEATPVIANVISLASAPTKQPSTSVAFQGSMPNIHRKLLGNASTQTDAASPRVLKNKALLCRPMVINKGLMCKPNTVHTETQTDPEPPNVLILPVPVPVFLPVPMSMYSQFCPKPVTLPVPLPVPMFLPVALESAERIMETIQEIKEKIPADPLEADLILMAEIVAEQDEKKAEPAAKDPNKERDGLDLLNDYISSYSGDLDVEDPDGLLGNWSDPCSGSGLTSPSQPYASEKLPPILDVRAGKPNTTPPPMDIEADFPVETLENMARLRQLGAFPNPTPTRRRQAPRKAQEKKRVPAKTLVAQPDKQVYQACNIQPGGRHSRRSAEPEATAHSKEAPACAPPILQSKYGTDAWKRWTQWRKSQPHLETPRIASRPIELKEDVLRCSTAELSYGLCHFITEVKRPNGESYAPDSLFYLCLGIQQHLLENGRVENIFTDAFYGKFSMEITRLLKDFKPSITLSGYVHSRVEEEYLWDCKQLGAYSPIVLLNTLLFFCSKYLGFTTVEQHRQLSFAHFMRCTKLTHSNTRLNFLRFYPPLIDDPEPDTDPDIGVPAKKKREEDGAEVLEMKENNENPLRCPVRLYEFYLSKCSETVKQRSNVFYLHPERCCVPSSPLWFSSTPLDDDTMAAMLTRILSVRELHLHQEKGGAGGGARAGGARAGGSDDPLYTPDVEEGGDSE